MSKMYLFLYEKKHFAIIKLYTDLNTFPLVPYCFLVCFSQEGRRRPLYESLAESRICAPKQSKCICVFFSNRVVTFPGAFPILLFLFSLMSIATT